MLSPHTAPMSNTTVTPRGTMTEHTLKVVRWRSASWVSRTDVCCAVLSLLAVEHMDGGQPKPVGDRNTSPAASSPQMLSPAVRVCRPLCVLCLLCVCCLLCGVARSACVFSLLQSSSVVQNPLCLPMKYKGGSLKSSHVLLYSKT